MNDGPSDPTGRALRLLSLLQTHRRWSSDELATELDVTTRTVRRDIDRLRVLGYPVDAAPGADGGYRLAAGAHLPPLMFDDEEAVALAVGLWSAASSPLTGVENTAMRALAKVESLMHDRVRRRVSAITSNVSTHRWGESDTGSVDFDTVTTVTTACRDLEEIRFSYVSKSGDETDRLVEPHRLIAIDRCWYLLAWDLRRGDWRTFRMDRMRAPRAAGRRFSSRPVPGGDPAAFVASNLGAAYRAFTIRVRVGATIDAIDAVAPWLTSDATPRPDGTTDVVLHAGRAEQVAVQIARLAARFDVVVVDERPATDEVLEQVRTIAARLADVSRAR